MRKSLIFFCATPIISPPMLGMHISCLPFSTTSLLLQNTARLDASRDITSEYAMIAYSPQGPNWIGPRRFADQST